MRGIERPRRERLRRKIDNCGETTRGYLSREIERLRRKRKAKERYRETLDKEREAVDRERGRERERRVCVYFSR